MYCVIDIGCNMNNTKYWREYLRECAKDPNAVKKHPDFWKNMYDDTPLMEEKCDSKKPRVGKEYQCDVPFFN